MEVRAVRVAEEAEVARAAVGNACAAYVDGECVAYADGEYGDCDRAGCDRVGCDRVGCGRAGCGCDHLQHPAVGGLQLARAYAAPYAMVYA